MNFWLKHPRVVDDQNELTNLVRFTFETYYTYEGTNEVII